jgi:hypothetical protein
MKTAQEIVRSIQVQPQFKKLQQYQCIEKILAVFLPSLHRFFEFGYIKNKTLFFVLNHNAGKQEFDNNIKMIKDVLNHAKPQECLGVEFHDMKAFVTYKARKKTSSVAVENNTAPMYKERAKGEFTYEFFRDERLISIAQEIQKIIKKNQNDT